MENKKRVIGATFVGSLILVTSSSRADIFSADWWNKNVAKPVHQEVIKPTGKAFVSVGQVINKEVLKPTEQAFVKLGQDIDKQVIQPVNVNVVKPTIGVAETIINIVEMAILIKNMVPPIQQVIANITTQINTLSKIKNGKEVVDPIFATLHELTKLPPHFQAILDKVASSLSAIEAIVRPSSATDADKIKSAAVEIRSISASVDDITRKVAKLNSMLHVRVKAMAESADRATNEILAIIK